MEGFLPETWFLRQRPHLHTTNDYEGNAWGVEEISFSDLYVEAAVVGGGV